MGYRGPEISAYYVGLNEITRLCHAKGYTIRFICDSIGICVTSFRKVFQHPYKYLTLQKLAALALILDLPFPDVLTMAFPKSLRYGTGLRKVKGVHESGVGKRSQAKWFLDE